MNLLELMLKEEIEWPVGAEFATQDGDGEKVKFGCGRPPKHHGYGIWHRDVEVSTAPICRLSSDWSTSIITREEYQAAGGWMKLGGNMISPPLSEISETRDCYRLVENNSVVQLDNTEIEPPKKMRSHIECGFEPFISVEDAQECKAKHAATAKQQQPKGSGSPILGMVLADLTNRALEGKEKYGEPLKAHNGRNALWDAYQEALDLAMYLRQAIEEQECLKN